MGGCSMSRKLCYFCREHEMRPLPTGKQREKRKKKPKVLSGYWPWVGKFSKQHTGVKARWLQTHLPHKTEMKRLAWVLEVGSSSVFADHQHLSSVGKMMWQEQRGHRRGGKEGKGRWLRARPVESLTSGFQASPPYCCLSRLLTLCATAGSIIPLRVRVPFVPPWPQRLLIVHSPPSEAEGMIKVGKPERPLTHSDPSVKCHRGYHSHSIMQPTP